MYSFQTKTDKKIIAHSYKNINLRISYLKDIINTLIITHVS